MVLPIIGAAIGGILSASAAKSAGRTQAEAAQNAADAQLTASRESNQMLRDFRAEDIARFDPFYQGGLDAYNALRFETLGGAAPTVGGTRNPLSIETLTETIPGAAPASTGNWMQDAFLRGSGGTPDQNVTRYRVGGNVFDTMKDAQAYANTNATTEGGTTYGGFTASPGYQFRLQEGLDAAQGSVAARQGLVSGAALDALNRTAQNYASNEYGNYYNRLAGLASSGQNAAGMLGAANQNYGAQIAGNTMAGGNAAAQGIASSGDASAAGTMGMSNAFNNALGQGIGLWQTNQLMKAFSQPSAQSWNNANTGTGMW